MYKKINCNSVCPPVPDLPTIDSLPNELLYLILNNLSLKEKIGVEMVCRKWSEVLKSLYLSQNSLHISNGWSLNHFEGCSDQKHNDRTGIYLINKYYYNLWSFSNQIDRQLLAPILERCLNIKSIRLENCYIDCQTFLWLIEMCPKLECLALIEIIGFSEPEWMVVAEKLNQRLKHFAISDCQYIYCKSLIPILPSLEELTVLYNMSPLNQLLANLGPNIRKLSIKCCEDLNIETIKALVFGNGKQLIHLTIDDPWIEDEKQTLELICRHMHSLQYLSIGFGSMTTTVRPIIELKELRQLEVNSSLERWTDMSGLTMAKVENLLLNAYFSPKHLSGIEKVFPNLRKFSIYFQCECEPKVMVYMYYSICKKCNDLCFQFIPKLKFLKYFSLNGEMFYRK